MPFAVSTTRGKPEIRSAIPRISWTRIWRMDIFGNLPLASVYIVVSFVAEMLCGLEVYNVAAILLPCEDMGQRGFVPLVTVFLVQRLIFTSSPPPVFHVECGGRDLLVFQIYGNLVSVLNNGIDSEKPDTLEFAPFINIMSEWYARDISKKVKTGIRTKGTFAVPRPRSFM